MKVEEFFARHPVFTRGEFAAAYHARGAGTARAVEALLAYHTGAGNVLRVRRGLYAVVPPGMDVDSAPVDPYLVAAKTTPDAVLAYHTALEVHGVAYSTHERLLFLTHHTCRSWSFRSMRFRPVRVPRALRGKGAGDTEVSTVDRSGLDMRVTTLERTLVDVLGHPDLGGGWEEVWRALEAIGFLNLDRLIDYALLLGNATTAAKVGFFLQQHRAALAVDDLHLRRLEAHTPRQPHYLQRNGAGATVYLRDWNLVVPSALVERAWQEVP
jgi:predicted transcriptional regulator of viral defense system